MYRYRVYEHNIVADFPLDLPSFAHDSPHFKVVRDDGCTDESRLVWIHDFEIEPGLPWARIGKAGSDLLFRVLDQADFLVNERAGLISCRPCACASENTIEHLLLDQVIPRILSRRGFLVMHAGVVCNEAGAAGFIGPTGRGKSTLTAFLGQNGFEILSDDCLVLQRESNGFTAFPSYPGIRLNPDMACQLTAGSRELSSVADYSTKLRVKPEQGGYAMSAGPVSLRVLFILDGFDSQDRGRVISIKKCSKTDAVGHVVKNLFRFDYKDKGVLADEFENLHVLADLTPAYVLEYPRKEEMMKAVHREVKSILTRL